MALRVYHSHTILARACAILLLSLLITALARSGESRGIDSELLLPSLAPLIKRISPAVVGVTSTKHAPLDSRAVDPDGGFPDGPPPRAHTEIGAGVIVDADLGLVVTSNHLVENSEAITIALSDGLRLEATVLGNFRS